MSPRLVFRGIGRRFKRVKAEAFGIGYFRSTFTLQPVAFHLRRQLTKRLSPRDSRCKKSDEGKALRE